MCPRWFEKGKAQKWKEKFVGAISAILLPLLPMTAIGSIANFAWDPLSLSYTGTDANPFTAPDTSLTSSAQGVLRLTLVTAGTTTMSNGGDIWSFTGHFDVQTATTSLGGSWTNLNNISNISSGGGDLNIKVVESGNSTLNNMFGSSGTDYKSTNQPPATANLAAAKSLPIGTGYTVTVTITFSRMSFTGDSSTPFMLQLQ